MDVNMIQTTNNKALRIIEVLDGLEIMKAKIELEIVLHILEVTNNPINHEKIKSVWFKDMESKKKLDKNAKSAAIKNPKIHGHDHTCIAHTNQIYIYHRTSLWYYKLCANQCLYYALTKDGSKCLKKLTKTNLLNDYKTTRFEDPLVNFLKNNSVYKRNLITKEFEILTILK